MTEPQIVQLPQLVTIPDVEICAAGTWQLSTGEVTFTAADLAAGVQASQCPAVGSPVLKLGHVDPRFDGEPAVGRLVNLRATADGAKLTADLAGVPAWLAAAMPSAYPNRSIEGLYGYQCQIGHQHPFVVTGLALLGVTAPGVGVLSSLKDVAALYGVAAATGDQDRTWNLRMGEVMATATPNPNPATTVEDIRRSYYDNPATPPTYWITEIQLSPLQMIVADEANGILYRVPVTLASDGEATFGDPVPVQVTYVDSPQQTAAASAANPVGRALAVAAKLRNQADEQLGQLAAMRVAAGWNGGQMVKNLGTSPTKTQIDALYALPAATKSASKLPHHDVSSTGVVGPADVDGVEAALAALNGSQGGVKDLSATDREAAYKHLAAHYEAAGKTAPPLKTSAAANAAEGLPDNGPLVNGPADQNPAGEGPADSGPVHGQFTGTHSHDHSAYGADGHQDGHAHSHMADANHDHHGAATSGATVGASAGHHRTEEADMQFSDEQLGQMRAKLGLAEDAELTPDAILAAVAQPGSGVQASGKSSGGSDSAAKPEADTSKQDPATGDETPVQAASPRAGMVMVDPAVLDELRRNAKLGADAHQVQRLAYRDGVIAAAIRDGKTPPARREHWEQAWDVDPEGTEQTLASLATGLIPLTDIGAPAGEPGDAGLTEYKALFGEPNSTRK